MKGDGEMRRALTRLTSVGSGALSNEEFAKLVEILRDDPRLGKVRRVSAPVEAVPGGFKSLMLKLWGVEAEHWEIEGFPGQTILDMLLPENTGRRLLIRILDLEHAALYEGFSDMDGVRQHRRLMQDAGRS